MDQVDGQTRSQMMSDPIAEMLEQVGHELAQTGVSLETLAAQALGKVGFDAPDGLSLLAVKFSPEHALWFFEFLRGYLTGPAEEKAGEMPDPGKFAPQVMAAISGFPLSEAERKEILDSMMQPFEKAEEGPPAEAPSPKGSEAAPETPEQMIANLEKKAEELQKQLDAKLAELKVSAEPPAEPPAGEPAKAPEVSEQGVTDLEKTVQDLQQALEEAMGKLPAGETV